MNIAGVGPLEIVAIFIIMLVVAGPKRMVGWAYTLGQYVAKLRAMFQETMDAVRKEIDLESLDIRKDIPSLPSGTFDIVSEASRVINADLAKVTSPSKSDSSTDTASPPDNAPDKAVETTTAPSDSPTPASEKHSDDEKPRYDAWTPN